MEEVKKGRLIQSVYRAAKILEHLAAHNNKDSLVNISKALGLSKSTVYTLLSTWEQLGYVQQDQENGRYSLGLKLFELGQVVHSSMDLRTISMPHLRNLATKYGETAHLAVLVDSDVVYIDKVDSPRSIRIFSRIGGRNPAHCTGVGKVLLSGLTESQLVNLIGGRTLPRYTDNTITGFEELKHHLRKVRDQGYAIDQEEIENGLFCIAAPIKNYQGTVIAAISLSGPTARMQDGGVEQIIVDLVETARKISSGFAYVE